MGLKLVMGSSTVYFLFLFFLLCVCKVTFISAEQPSSKDENETEVNRR